LCYSKINDNNQTLKVYPLPHMYVIKDLVPVSTIEGPNVEGFSASMFYRIETFSLSTLDIQVFNKKYCLRCQFTLNFYKIYLKYFIIFNIKQVFCELS